MVITVRTETHDAGIRSNLKENGYWGVEIEPFNENVRA